MTRCYLPFTTEERLKESLHIFSTQKNEAMNNSVAKYAPKTRTYSTSMSLTNRVMIAIGCCNLGFYIFWNRVYADLGLIMLDDTKAFLEEKDKNKLYRKEYQRKVETKRHRSESKCKQIKELMEKQKKDEKRGATYGAGVAIESDTFQIPAAIKAVEKKKKLELNSLCPWEGCYKRDCHKTN